MDSFLELSLLFDYYGNLLTQMQQNICKMYYNQNLSLTEISEDLGITKQGVRDALKKAESLLYKYESALNLKAKNDKITDLVQKIETLIDRTSIDLPQKEKIIELTEQINSLI